MHSTYSVSSVQDAERLGMDRRRLELAHLKYAILNVCSWYPSLCVKDIVFVPGNVDERVLEFSKKYYLLFSSKYAG